MMQLYRQKAKKKLKDIDSLVFLAYNELLQEVFELEELIRMIELEICPNEDLSNGDEITVDIYYDNEIAKKQKIRFTGESIKQKVEDPSPILEIDPFENLTVSFSGISPAGYPEYKYNGDDEYISSYSFEIDKTSLGEISPTKVYFPVGYKGIVSLPNDEFMFISYEGILGSAYFDNSWYKTKGYIDGVDMFKKIITANRDSYTYEVSEGLKEFGQ